MSAVYKFEPNSPYSLFDMKISALHLSDGNLKLTFPEGYTDVSGSGGRVRGRVAIEKVDLNTSCVLILNEKGSFGEFIGKKLTLSEFIENYRAYDFIVKDEAFGVDKFDLFGYINFPGSERITEAHMMISFKGNIIYETLD